MQFPTSPQMRITSDAEAVETFFRGFPNGCNKHNSTIPQQKQIKQCSQGSTTTADAHSTHSTAPLPPHKAETWGVNPYTRDNSCTRSQMTNHKARQNLNSGFHTTVFHIIFKPEQHQIPSHDLGVMASTSPDCIWL